MLNANGVYYFWQVADWTAADIEVVDDRLDAFRGRIERDNWVAQAKTLSNATAAAKRPTDQAMTSMEARL